MTIVLERLRRQSFEGRGDLSMAHSSVSPLALHNGQQCRPAAASPFQQEASDSRADHLTAVGSLKRLQGGADGVNAFAADGGSPPVKAKKSRLDSSSAGTTAKENSALPAVANGRAACADDPTAAPLQSGSRSRQGVVQLADVPATGGSTAASGSRAPSLQAPPPGATRPTGLTTFADLALNQFATASQQQLDAPAMEARKAALLSLRLAPPSGAPGASQQPHAAAGPSGRPPLPGQASGAAQQQLGGTLQAALTTAAAAPAPEVLVQGCLPYDWALKTSVRFTSTHRFMAYEASAIASCKHSFHGAGSCQRQPWAGMSVQEKWRCALTSWRCPAASWDPATVGALQRAAPAVLEERLGAWREGFASAYMAVRHGQCCALYLESPQGCRHPTTVLFAAPGARGNALPTAWVSSSSRHARRRMQAAGLPFSMPLAPALASSAASLAPAKAGAAAPQRDVGGTAATTTNNNNNSNGSSSHPGRLQPPDPDFGDDDEWLGGAAAQGGGAAALGAGVRDHSPQSLLLFEGPHAVHLLFDWLVHETGFGAAQQQALTGSGGGGEGCDVPVLLAPAPFACGTAWCPDVKSSISTTLVPTGGAAAAAAAAAGAPQQLQQQQQHVLELGGGPIPPWTLCRASLALAEASVPCGQQPMQLEVQTQQHSLALNTWQSGGGADVQSGGAEEQGAAGDAGGSWLAGRRGGARASGWEVVPGERQAVCGAPGFLGRRVLHRAALELQAGGAGELAQQHRGGSLAFKLRLSG